MRGWLHKQDSSGLRLWKRRWFVLADLCLYYYRDSSEQRVRGGLPLPGYEIRVLPPAPRAPQFLFTAEHPGMRTYCLGAETPEELHAWVCALRRGASPLPGSLGYGGLGAQGVRGASPLLGKEVRGGRRAQGALSLPWGVGYGGHGEHRGAREASPLPRGRGCPQRRRSSRPGRTPGPLWGDRGDAPTPKPLPQVGPAPSPPRLL
ncbi:pleckstrin homology domain-containing family A member 4-like [Pseudopipra pipra]|uniref:pleckstrin homology domain-containing family A member 4-like n=1 Tax=Pseudopipra pipra TaxID=415032 RepID=UPI003139A764